MSSVDFLTDIVPTNKRCIALIDVSGSISSVINTGIHIGINVYEVMIYELWYVLEINYIEFINVVLFGSLRFDSHPMKKGYHIEHEPFPVTEEGKQKLLTLVKSMASTKNFTVPVHGLNNIPKEWLTINNDLLNIIHVGDGDLFAPGKLYKDFDVEVKFKESIEKLFKHKHVRYELLMVDTRYTEDEKQDSSLIYDIFTKNKLTSKCSGYTIYYTKTNKHIDVFTNNIVPYGFIAYGDKMFSYNNEPKFLEYVKDLVKSSIETDIYEIVRCVVGTIGHIIETNKFSQSQSNLIIDVYDEVFTLFQSRSDNVTAFDVRLSFKDGIDQYLLGSAYTTGYYKTHIHKRPIDIPPKSELPKSSEKKSSEKKSSEKKKK
jgi:hypothetical protein